MESKIIKKQSFLINEILVLRKGVYIIFVLLMSINLSATDYFVGSSLEKNNSSGLVDLSRVDTTIAVSNDYYIASSVLPAFTCVIDNLMPSIVDLIIENFCTSSTCDLIAKIDGNSLSNGAELIWSSTIFAYNPDDYLENTLDSDGNGNYNHVDLDSGREGCSEQQRVWISQVY